MGGYDMYDMIWEARTREWQLLSVTNYPHRQPAHNHVVELTLTALTFTHNSAPPQNQTMRRHRHKEPSRPHPSQRPARLDSRGHVMTPEEQRKEWSRRGLCMDCGMIQISRKVSLFGMKREVLVRSFVFVWLVGFWVWDLNCLMYILYLAGVI